MAAGAETAPAFADPGSLGLGVPGAGYPWPWSIYGWFDGKPAHAERIDDLGRFAADLAHFPDCRIFRVYAAGRSPRAIAYDLNHDRIPAPRGAAWNASTINGSRTKGTGILRVDLYRGLIVWNKMRYIRDPSTGRRVSRPNSKSEWQTSAVPHLRILDSSLWEGVQARLGETGEKGGRTNRPKTKRLLSGLLKCGACGSGMTISGTSEGRLRIGCSRHKESRSCDHSRTYDLDLAERGVVNVLRRVLSDQDALKKFIDSYVAERRRLMSDICQAASPRRNKSRQGGRLAR